MFADTNLFVVANSYKHSIASGQKQVKIWGAYKQKPKKVKALLIAKALLQNTDRCLSKPFHGFLSIQLR